MNNLAPSSGSSSDFNGLFDFEHYWRMALHRKWLVLIIFLVVSAGVVVYARRLPNVYTSETMILVDPQQVPNDYVRSTVSGDVRDRLSTLSEQILSTTRLQKVIETLHLYPDQMRTTHLEDVIATMRQNIGVGIVGGPAGGGALQAFKISFTSNDPKTAAEVANKLASLLIEENLGAREQMITGTTDFIDNQLQETKKGLEDLEAKIGDFKRQHPGEMPEQQQGNMEMLAQLQTRLQMLSDAIYRAEQQRTYLQAVQTAQSSPPAATSGNSVGSVPAPAPEPPTPAEVQLQQMLLRYGEGYPDVKHLRMVIETERRRRKEAEQKAESERKAAELAAPAKQTAGSESESASDVTADASGSPEIQGQLAVLEREITKDKKDQQDVLDLIATYQKKVEAEPIREQEVTDLVRDYGISKEHYQQLLDKKLSAQMATQLELRQKAEKFIVLDTARVPTRPSRPNRLSMEAAGALGGLALGLAAALCTEILGTTLVLASQIDPALGIAVLGVIPRISTRRDRRRQKVWMWVGAAGGVAAIAVACVFLYHRYFNQIL